MASLGDLSPAAVGPVDVEFEYFGGTFRMVPMLSDIPLVDFLESAQALGDGPGAGAQRMILVKQFLRDTVHPDDFDRFWLAAKANGQGIDDVANVAIALVESVAERPTVQPSDSSAGLSATPASSEGDSFSRALAKQSGRPDLQVITLMAKEARAV